MTRESLTLKVDRTGDVNHPCFILGVAHPDSASFVRLSKAMLFSAYTFKSDNIREFTRTDGVTTTTLGTTIASLELSGDLPVIDGTATRATIVKFHVVADQDMACDAILGTEAMSDLARKYGEEAVSHDNSWGADEREAEEAPPNYEATGN